MSVHTPADVPAMKPLGRTAGRVVHLRGAYVACYAPHLYNRA
jgi:hypothetical protein